MLLAAVPALLGLHCPRRCPDVGPRHEAPIEIDRPMQRAELRRTLVLVDGIVGQELRVREVSGALTLAPCDPASSPWSATVTTAGTRIELPPDLKCLTIEGARGPDDAEAPRWTLRGDLVIIREYALTGLKGTGVHGQECPLHEVFWQVSGH